jgi:hypothetical protein
MSFALVEEDPVTKQPVSIESCCNICYVVLCLMYTEHAAALLRAARTESVEGNTSMSFALVRIFCYVRIRIFCCLADLAAVQCASVSQLLMFSLLLLLQIRRVIPNPTIKHNFSQLLARAEGDRAQVRPLQGQPAVLCVKLIGCEGIWAATF